MFRLAVETGSDGGVSRIVFLALRGEEGRTECFCPVPIDHGSSPRPSRGGASRNDARSLQRPLTRLLTAVRS